MVISPPERDRADVDEELALLIAARPVGRERHRGAQPTVHGVA
jgi:hypothetical protein